MQSAVSIKFLAGVASLTVVGGALMMALPALAAPEQAWEAPAPRLDPPVQAKRATAYFAGGCFWGVEGVLSHVKGVIAAESGFGGGPADQRVDYDKVSTGRTGYAETVRITYDPRQISYGTLLRVFFSVVADPTQMDYQGPDHGTQYRSALFPQSANQAKVARAYLTQLGKSDLWSQPIVTRIESVGRFQPAAAYHQDYMARHPYNGYISMWDAPKLAAFKKLYPALYVANPVS